MFIAALSMVAKLWKQPKRSLVGEWIKKQWYVYNGILLSHQKERNPAVCNNTDGSRRNNAKSNESVRERQIPYDFTHIWNLRNKANEQRRKKKRQTKKGRWAGG